MPERIESRNGIAGKDDKQKRKCRAQHQTEYYANIHSHASKVTRRTNIGRDSLSCTNVGILYLVPLNALSLRSVDLSVTYQFKPMATQAETNKQNVIAFYELMFNDCKPREAIERYAGDMYIQHNPFVADGKEAFIAYFEKMAKEYPGKRVEVKLAVAEGNLVALRCRQTWPGEKDWVGADFFRLDDNGKIVEHWDVLQVMPDTFAHGNGMF
jgi:predicted SnoaL-like aldol condensation-catalyzing enzyme